MRKLYEEHRHSGGLFSLLLFDAVTHHFCILIGPVLCAFSLSVPDIVETLLPLLSNCNRTRRQVVTQLLRMGLVDNAKELKKPKSVTVCG